MSIDFAAIAGQSSTAIQAWGTVVTYTALDKPPRNIKVMITRDKGSSVLVGSAIQTPVVLVADPNDFGFQEPKKGDEIKTDKLRWVIEKVHPKITAGVLLQLRIEVKG